MERVKDALVDYCQQSAELAVKAWGNAPPPVEEELLSAEEEARLKAGEGIDLVIVPVVQGEGTVVESAAVGEILVVPLVEGDVVVEPAVELKMRPAAPVAKRRRRRRRSDAAKKGKAAAEVEVEEVEDDGEETRYCGVRKRFGKKYVAEILNPIWSDRVWLGTYDKPEMGAWAYDTAARILRGKMAATNFPRPAPPPVLTEEIRVMLAYFDTARRVREEKKGRPKRRQRGEVAVSRITIEHLTSNEQ